MAYSNYPSDILPIPSANYSFSVESACRQTRMESGRIRQTQIYTSQYHEVKASWDFDDDEFRTFKLWYNGALRNGSDWFTGKFAFGDGVKTNKAQFTDGYNFSFIDSFNWRVTANLQLEDIDEITSQSELETAGAPLGLIGTDWVDVLPPPQIGYSCAVTSSNARTPIEAARYFNRKRFQRNLHIVNISWQLSDAQMHFFKGWHRVILALGTLPFDIDLAFGDGMKSNEAFFQSGNFTARYSPSDAGGFWTVSAALVVDAVNESESWDDYLARYESESAALPLPSAGSIALAVSGSGVIDLYGALLESQDFVQVSALSLPLESAALLESQDLISDEINAIKLTEATLETGSS